MKAPSTQLLRVMRRAATAQPLSMESHSHPQHHYLTARHALQATIPSTSRCAFSSLMNTAYNSAPRSTDRGPTSKEDTQTDFGSLDVLGNIPLPTAAIDACLTNGFHFDNGLKINDGSGCLIVAGEAFSWRPWELRSLGRKSMINSKGQWNVDIGAWGILDLVWPKPGTSCE